MAVQESSMQCLQHECCLNCRSHRAAWYEPDALASARQPESQRLGEGPARLRRPPSDLRSRVSVETRRGHPWI